MNPSRRGFLMVMAGLSQAHALVRGGTLGQVVFCRVSEKSVTAAEEWLRAVFDGALPVGRSGPALRYGDFVAAYQEGLPELVICGTEGTLVLDAAGSRHFVEAGCERWL